MRKVSLAGCGCLALCVLLLMVFGTAVIQHSEFLPPVPQEATGAPLAAAGPTEPAGWENSHGWYVSSPFGWRAAAWPGFWEWHGGVDLAGPQFEAGMPVVPIQDGRIFDIRYQRDRYSAGGLCVSVVNDRSFEEVPLLVEYCHLWPYQVRGHVYDAATGEGIAGAVVYITDKTGGIAGERTCGPCDENRDGLPDFRLVERGGVKVLVTGGNGFWCYDYSTPDGSHAAVIELPAGYEIVSPSRPRVSFEIRVEKGTAYDVEINFYAQRPGATPTPTPLPTPGPTGARMSLQVSGAPFLPTGPKYVPGFGPPVTFHTDILQNRTILGYIGWTGRMTGPHLHLAVHRIYGYRLNKYGYNRPRYPDGTPVPEQFLIVGEGIGRTYLTDAVDPMQYLPLANAEFGLAYMDQPVGLPPPGHPDAGAGVWWSPGDLFSNLGGGRLRGYIWRWFDWLQGLFCGICPCGLCPKCCS